MDPQIVSSSLAKEGHGFGVQNAVTIRTQDALTDINGNPTPQLSPLATIPAFLVPPIGALNLIVVCSQGLKITVGDSTQASYHQAPPGQTTIPCLLNNRGDAPVSLVNGVLTPTGRTNIYFSSDDNPIFGFNTDNETFSFYFEMMAP